MKLCFIVMAHHEPIVFHRLMSAISWPNSDVVVHIDARSDMAEFRVPDLANVRFVEDREEVRWSGWSQTVATMKALSLALKVSDAGYFIFLAGTDFPIKSARQITGHLAGRFPFNILNHYPLVPGLWGYSLIDQYKLIDLKSRFVDIRKKADPAMPGPERFLGDIVQSIEDRLNKDFRPRPTSATRFYHGSSRWCLNRDTVKFVTDYFCSPGSRILRDYTALCANSDELFIPTAVLNSDLRWQCEAYDEAQCNGIFARAVPPLPDEKRVYLHYIDWSKQRENPAILVEDDLLALRQSGKYFACKFLWDKSMKLLDLLEEEIR